MTTRSDTTPAAAAAGVTTRSASRTRLDFAHVIRDLVDGRYKYATKVVLVPDNLNTHSVASLYAAFPAGEAKRIADELEIHYHAQARVVAEHRRVRAERAGPPVPGPAGPRPADAGGGGGRVGVAAERGGPGRRLAVHHG